MAVKKAAPSKKVGAKKSPARKTAKGDSYECEVCGLVVTVDETCGCVDVCDIICCSKPMKPKARKKPAKK
jgi:hypothetical protein